MEQRDLIIIGGGPAGYIAGIRARQLGGKVTMIERDTVGGVCLNHGCVPTRAMVRGVEFIDLPKKAKDYGVNFGDVEIDFAKMVARKDTVVKTVVGGLSMLVEANGVEVLKGSGTLLSPSEVEVALEDGTSNQLTAPKILIATGASPKKPDIPGAEKIITTDDALGLTEIPKSILIIGGGPIGFSFATIFSKLGTAVTVIDESTQVLPGVDGELITMLQREIRKAKIQIHTGTTIKEIKDGADNENSVLLNTGEEEITINAQYIVIADEREANLEGFGLDKSGVEISEGNIKVNSRMETGVDSILAAGDVIGGHLLAHVAFAEGKVAAENAMGKQTEIDYSAVPKCFYTSPEIASVGLTEDEARAQGHELKIGRFPYGANAMATILGERTGAIKVISEAKHGQVLGVHIIGANATYLIPEAALAMRLDATPREITATIHAHPSLSEAMFEAALDVSGETLHSISQNK